MKTFKFDNSHVYYKNIGQQVEASLRAMFGFIPKADHNKGGHDIIIDGRTYQIKSLRATVCYGLDHENIRTEYAEADGFIFGEPTESIAYVMTFDEFIDFAKAFPYPDYDSQTKVAKMRLDRKYKKQREWLQARA